MKSNSLLIQTSYGRTRWSVKRGRCKILPQSGRFGEISSPRRARFLTQSVSEFELAFRRSQSPPTDDASVFHYREIYHTPENPRPKDLRRLEQVRRALGGLLMAEEIADRSWYKVGKPDIPVITDNSMPEIVPLSKLSSAISGLAPVEKVILFCRKEDVEEARRRLSSVSQRRKPR